MSVRRYLGDALVTASAAIVPVGAPPAGADPGSPHPCDTEWMPPRTCGICDNDPTTGPVRLDGPSTPIAPGGPVPSRPGALR
jgi:hypothetical protein